MGIGGGAGAGTGGGPAGTLPWPAAWSGMPSRATLPAMRRRGRRVSSGSILAWVAVGLVLACAVPALAGPDHGDRAAFDRKELARLKRGELVERRVIQERAGLRLMGGTSWQVIDAKPDVVWQALLDTKHYHRMMPQVLEARLVDEAGDRRTVFMRQGSPVLYTSYYLDVSIDREQHQVRFEKDSSRPGSLRAAWGFYEVRPYGDRTLLAYGVMADPGGLIGGLLRGTVHEWMMKVPWMMKRFIEGSGRYIYH